MAMFLTGLGLACRAVAMLAAASAARFRYATWRKAGHQQLRWTVGPLLGALVFAPLGLLAAIAYVSMVRPALIDARRTERPVSF